LSEHVVMVCVLVWPFQWDFTVPVSCIYSSKPLLQKYQLPGPKCSSRLCHVQPTGSQSIWKLRLDIWWLCPCRFGTWEIWIRAVYVIQSREPMSTTNQPNVLWFSVRPVQF